MTIFSDNESPKLVLVEQGSTPDTPSSGQQKLFIRDSDHVLCLVNSSGTVTPIAGGGGSGIPVTGWVDASGNTWTFVSADGPTGIFNVNADVTTVLSVGMRVKYTQTTPKYGIITAVGAFSSGSTPITIYGGTDYTLANAAITSPYYSPVKAPVGFPTSPIKWTVKVTDVTLRSQNPATSLQWYNLGSITISVPIGSWLLRWEATGECYTVGGSQKSLRITLSTANNSESDAELSARYVVNGTDTIGSMTRSKKLLLAAKTSYYLNVMTDNTGAEIDLDNANEACMIEAVSAYL